MAILKEDNLSVEIKFTDYEYGWVYYEFRFFCASEPAFNPNTHQANFFFANEHRGDSLIPTLEEALSGDKGTEWQPTEPDMWIEIEYHNKQGWEDYQPNIENKHVWVSDGYKEELKKIDEQRREAGGKLPDDYFQLTFFVDSSKLKQLPNEKTGGYTGDGIAFRIGVSREKLETFVKELKADYQKFLELHKDEVREMYKEAGLSFPI